MVETRSQKRQAAQAAQQVTAPHEENKPTSKMNGSSATASSSTLPPPLSSSSSSQQPSQSANHQNGDQKDITVAKTPPITILAMIAIVAITALTIPETLQPTGKPTVNHVWYFGWISAVSTGLGVLPLIFSPDFNTYWVGVTNCKFKRQKYIMFVDDAMYHSFIHVIRRILMVIFSWSYSHGHIHQSLLLLELIHSLVCI